MSKVPYTVCVYSAMIMSQQSRRQACGFGCSLARRTCCTTRGPRWNPFRLYKVGRPVEQALASPNPMQALLPPFFWSVREQQRERSGEAACRLSYFLTYVYLATSSQSPSRPGYRPRPGIMCGLLRQSKMAMGRSKNCTHAIPMGQGRCRLFCFFFPSAVCCVVVGDGCMSHRLKNSYKGFIFFLLLIASM